MAEHNIKVIYNCKISQIGPTRVTLSDGTHLACNVPVWATGAVAQAVAGESDLATLHGYFRVNDCFQSTSHSNVFAGGDCISPDAYKSKLSENPELHVDPLRLMPDKCENSHIKKE